MKSLFVAMRTKDVADAQTGSETVLIVNKYNPDYPDYGGFDVLHHTFGDTTQADQERGKANLYRVVNDQVAEFNSNEVRYVRVGIRGGNLWKPEYYFVWGQEEDEENEEGPVVPIAFDFNINTGLSIDKHDRGSATSIPLKKNIPWHYMLGDSETLISHLLLIMKTRNRRNAGTDNRITLTINGTHVTEALSTSIEGPHRGKVDFYFIPVEGDYQPFTRSAINSITLSTEGSDAWHPEMFFLFGLDALLISATPLIHIDNWDLGWLSADPGEGQNQIEWGYSDLAPVG